MKRGGLFRRARRTAEAGLSERGRAKAWERVEVWAKRLGAVVAIVGVLSAAVAFVMHRADGLLGGPDSDIEVSLVVVSDGSGAGGSMSLARLQSGAALPRLDITLSNKGKDPVLLTAARITIEDSASLPPCSSLPFTGPGWVPITARYPIDLPMSPTPRERVISHPLHDRVGAGGVDRPVLAFRTSPSSEEDRLYALRVQVVTDDPSQVVDIGRFVLAAPSPARPDGFVLPENDGSPPAPAAPGSPRWVEAWCLRRNLAAVKRVVAEPGRRSGQVAALARMPSPDHWAELAGLSSTSAAVEDLMRAGAPELAAFAAAGTGEPQLLAKTRQRGAALLVASAERELGEGALASGGSDADERRFSRAAVAARNALDLAPSPAATSLVERAEGQLRAMEEG